MDATSTQTQRRSTHSNKNPDSFPTDEWFATSTTETQYYLKSTRDHPALLHSIDPASPLLHDPKTFAIDWRKSRNLVYRNFRDDHHIDANPATQPASDFMATTAYQNIHRLIGKILYRQGR